MKITYKLVGDTELSLYLGKLSNKIKPEIGDALVDIGTHLKKEVQNKFGKYQASWPKLKRASVIAKYRRRSLRGAKGSKKAIAKYGGDDPLILFGDLQKSIQKETRRGELEVEVYSDNEYAAVHEYGYGPKNVPARSYMRLTLDEETDNIVDIVDKAVGRLI